MIDDSSSLIEMLTKSMDDIGKAKDNQSINAVIETLLLDFTDSDLATLYLFDTDKQRLYTQKDDSSILMINPRGLLGHAFLTKKPDFYNYMASNKNYIAEIDNPDDVKLKSQLLVPIVQDDTLLAIVKTSRSASDKISYTKKEIELVSSLNVFLIKIIKILTSPKEIKYDNKKDASKTVSDLDSIEIDIPTIEGNIKKVQKSTNSMDANSMMLFLSNTVHDIRTPANSLYGFLELLEDQITDKRLKVFVHQAMESANLINALTDTILEQMKENHTEQVSEASIVTSIKFFEQISNTFSANMLDKNLHYLIYIDPSIPKQIKIDELKLKRIITNLIGNAYKFTPAGKRIYFSVKFNNKSNKLKISVRDEGIGIDKSQQKNIFKAFKQAEEDTSAKFGGTGLGLAISAKYVNDLGGELELKSDLNEGSKFYFTMPIDIVNSKPSYEKFFNLNKKITILTDHKHKINVANIQKYLIELGMPLEKINISSELEDDTTHLFCEEHKITPEVLMQAKEQNMKVLLIEEKLFSMLKDDTLNKYNIIAENTYYGDLIHSTVFSGLKTRVLIADDNKINVMLLKFILETEFADVSSASDGKETLDSLKMAHERDEPFDIVFLDKHMPIFSGTEVMTEFRNFEKMQKLQAIFAISITGDPEVSEDEKDLFDLFVKKPFNKGMVLSAINLAKESVANKI